MKNTPTKNLKKKKKKKKKIFFENSEDWLFP